MRNIGALNAQRCLVHAQGILDILQRRRPRGEVAHALQLVLTQLLLGVLLHGIHKGAFIAALGNAQIDARTTQVFQEGHHLFGLLRHGLDQNLARDDVDVALFHVRFLVHPAPRHIRS